MGGFSPIHWIVIGVVALLLFGNRLPEVARSLGRAWNEFKRGLRDVGDELGKEDEPPRRFDAPRERDALPGDQVNRPTDTDTRRGEKTPSSTTHDQSHDA